MGRMRPLVLAILAVLMVAACGTETAATATGGRAGRAGRVVQVVATTTQVADFVRNVGGNRVTVHVVLKAGVDPHDYEPTPADIDAIAQADIVVKNGVGLEAWFDDTIDNAHARGTVVDASRGVPVQRGDPHIWHDPRNAKVMVANIAAALRAADGAGAAEYEANRAAYAGKLDDLDASIKAQVDTLANPKLVTNHDAFRYYADRYGLDVVGSVIPSFDTQAELSQQDINDLVARIKAEGVKAVFSEASLPPKTAEAIARQAGVKVVQGDDALYGDALGPEGSDGATYLAMEAHNTRVIVDNLR